MLLQFSVSNYGSIKNEVLFSLVPSTDKSHPENLVVSGRYKANAITAIYGANASGKSTLFKAMTNAIVFIRTSNLYQVGQGIPVVPYKFCDSPENNPTKFEFSFIADDGRKYVYGFSATVKAVIEEYLYCYKSAKASMVFERKGDSYEFSRGDKAVLSPLTRMNTSNKLFLSTATVWNAAQTIIPFKWFADKIDTQTSLDNLAGQALEEYRIHKEDNMQQKWVLRSRNLDYETITRKFNIDPIVAKVIRNREVVSDEEFELFLNGTLSECHAPELQSDG